MSAYSNANSTGSWAQRLFKSQAKESQDSVKCSSHSFSVDTPEFVPSFGTNAVEFKADAPEFVPSFLRNGSDEAQSSTPQTTANNYYNVHYGHNYIDDIHYNHDYHYNHHNNCKFNAGCSEACSGEVLEGRC